MELKRQYIVNENNQKVAVQLDIETFEKLKTPWKIMLWRNG